MPTNTQEKPHSSKVTLIPAKGVSQTINYLLEDRDELESVSYIHLTLPTIYSV